MEHKQITVALAGNPNVGKSTIFNGLTGLKQHTGNWSGVTVAPAAGLMKEDGQEYLLVDLPGTYSLAARSREEETARDFLNGGNAEEIVVVCDATCLERGLRLLKQIVETDCVRERGVPLILCVNLCDEARRKGIRIDFGLLQDVLQFPVVSCCARSTGDLQTLRKAIRKHHGKVTTILIAQRVSSVMNMNNILVMDDGKLCYDDTPEAVFAHYRELENMGLRAPALSYVLYGLKEKGWPIDTYAASPEDARALILGAMRK